MTNQIINRRNLYIALAILLGLLALLLILNARSGSEPATPAPITTEPEPAPVAEPEPEPVVKEVKEAPQTPPEAPAPAPVVQPPPADPQPTQTTQTEPVQPDLEETEVAAAPEPEPPAELDATLAHADDNNPHTHIDDNEPPVGDNNPPPPGDNNPPPPSIDIVPPKEEIILPQGHHYDPADYVVLRVFEGGNPGCCGGTQAHTVHLAVKLTAPDSPFSDVAQAEKFLEIYEPRIKACEKRSRDAGGGLCTKDDKLAIYNAVEAELEAPHQPLFDKAYEFARNYAWPADTNIGRSIIAYYYTGDDDLQSYIDNDVQHRVLACDDI